MGGAGGGSSVYHSALQFEPLVLEFGTSLDAAASVLERHAGDGAAGAVQKHRQTAPDGGDDGDRKKLEREQIEHHRIRRGTSVFHRGTIAFREGLLEAGAGAAASPVQDSPAGYPGHLTEDELEACLKFRRRLKEEQEPTVFRDMVYQFDDVEEEPYAICRYLRSGKFDVDATFRKMDEQFRENWLRGRDVGFFPDPAAALGGGEHKEAALLTQLPFVFGGVARNGCLVLYLLAGKIRPEGLKCVVSSLEDDVSISNWVWHCLVHKLRRRIADARAEDPSRFVRLQVMAAIDLDGMSVSALRQLLPVLEKAVRNISVFPELLFNVTVLNAPRFFSGFWPVIRAFLDPDTAHKVEIYSSGDAGRARLRELVADAELASDYGGSAPSTTELGARMAGAGVSRQVVELLAAKGRSRFGGGGKNEEATCNFALKEGEVAAIHVHTNAADGAMVALEGKDEGKSKPLGSVEMTRTADEPASGAFSRVLVTTASGPGDFQVSVRREESGQSGPEHFLVVGDVSKAP